MGQPLIPSLSLGVILTVSFFLFYIFNLFLFAISCGNLLQIVIQQIDENRNILNLCLNFFSCTERRMQEVLVHTHLSLHCLKRYWGAMEDGGDVIKVIFSLPPLRLSPQPILRDVGIRDFHERSQHNMIVIISLRKSAVENGIKIYRLYKICIFKVCVLFGGSCFSVNIIYINIYLYSLQTEQVLVKLRTTETY